MRSYLKDVIMAFFYIILSACSNEVKNNKIASESKINSNPTKDNLEAINDASQLEPYMPLGPDCVIEELIVKQLVGQNGIEETKNQLLKEIYQDGLTKERAVKLSLVNNPSLFAYYQNLELGVADLIEAGLRENPKWSESSRIPNESGYQLNNLYDMAFSFLDFFLIPLRISVAQAKIKVIESEISQKVLDLIKEVEINWLEVKILELELSEKVKLLELKELTKNLSKLQRKAGNISELNANNKEIKYEEAKEEIKSFKALIIIAREKLNISLGLLEPKTCWQISGDLDLREDFNLLELGDLEKAAIENRADIEAIRQEINALAKEAKLKQWWTYSNIKIGVSKEREPDGVKVTGPLIELEVPVFNYGQGEIKKYEALIKQAQERLLSKAIEACSEVRKFFNNANVYKSQLEDLETRILPDLSKQITLGQAQYNAMTLGVYQLFELKEAEIQAKIDQIHALKNFLKAKVELIHAVGGKK